MFHVASAFSGKLVAILNAEDVNGKSTKSLKTCLFSITGISRFHQRLFLEDGSEIVAEEELSLTPQTVQLVVLQYQTPNIAQEERLIAACRQGDVPSLEACLEEPQDPNLPFDFSDAWKGFCAIHVVAARGSLQCLHLLLEAGADKDSAGVGQYDATPLLIASQNGHIGVVRFLVEAGSDMHKPNNNGATALYVAAQNGHIVVVRFLVEAGADMHKPKNNGATPLPVAAQNGHIAVVRFLVEAGADMNKASHNGAIPLHLAAYNGHIMVMRFLVEAGADMNTPTEDGATPLYVAAQNGHIAVVRFLVEAGADMHKPKNNGPTPLYVAAQNGHIPVVRFLVEAGADMNKASHIGAIPLHAAAQNGHIVVVRFLVEAGADMHKPKNNGATPLYVAAHNDHIAVVRFLVEAGADKNTPAENGATPLHVAAHDGHIVVVRFLVEAGADMNKASHFGAIPLHAAAHNDHIEVVRFLVEAGADMNTPAENGATPLYVAAQNGHIEVVRFLVEAGADMNTPAENGATPLYVAAQNGHIVVVRFLVEAGADMNKARHFTGLIPLNVAAYNGHIQVVRFLVEAGAEMNKANGIGATPWHQSLIFTAFHAEVREGREKAGDCDIAGSTAFVQTLTAHSFCRRPHSSRYAQSSFAAEMEKDLMQIQREFYPTIGVNTRRHKDTIQHTLLKKYLKPKIVVDEPETTRWEVVMPISDSPIIYFVTLDKGRLLTLGASFAPPLEIITGERNLATFFSQWHAIHRYSKVFTLRGSMILEMDTDLTWHDGASQLAKLVGIWHAKICLFQAHLYGEEQDRFG
eukprot:Skav219662  [mRNA]  locus=scaffold1257:224834:230605:+ [translate_table: standard]